MIAVGSRVFLKGCPYGKPGTVVRIERNRAVVLWADLGPTYIGRHRPDSLMEISPESPEKPPQFSYEQEVSI